ncbi:transcriptional regulator [Streptococcus agalactiae LMG 14747]|uniref:Transcriptional regulator n=1 Tax=Streptococcus agalactiae LMG 14747 TaxID=1154860 RepID=V6YYS3_STRAG|nr:transcriptional regulator [Streptococcus agalactiae LMG 14747]
MNCKPLSKLYYNLVDDRILSVKNIDKEIKRRKLELETLHSSYERIEGVKSNRISKPTEWIIERYDSDVRLNSLFLLKESAEYTLEVLDDELGKMFYMRCYTHLSWEEIQMYFHLKDKQMKMKKERILEIFGRANGIII